VGVNPTANPNFSKPKSNPIHIYPGSMWILGACFGWTFLRKVRLQNERIKEAMAKQMALEAERAEGQALPQVIQDFTPFAEVPEVAAIFKSLDACQKAASIAIEVKASVGLVLELVPIPSCVTAKYSRIRV